jgi:hypothetical protein
MTEQVSVQPILNPGDNHMQVVGSENSIQGVNAFNETGPMTGKFDDKL